VRLRCSWFLTGLLLLPVAARLALLPWAGKPLPRIHDEFSYMMAGDTFASGRLTNPPHLLWKHFEAPHIIQQPTYASKYPPGQGLALAAGQWLAGHPWFGVVGSYAAMLAAFWWAFHAWLPGRWAGIACTLALVRYPIYHYWLNSYWGGAVAAIGGALLLGAAGRMRDRIRPAPAALGGIGLAMLALARPYEGLAFSVALLAPVSLVILKRCSDWIALVPGLLLLGVGLAFFARVNSATTGYPLLPAYMVHERQYPQEQAFVFREPPGSPRPGFWGRVQSRTPPVMDLVWSGGRREDWVNVGFGVALWIAVAFLWLDRRRRWLACAICLMFVAHLLPAFYSEHYAAPEAGLKILIIAAGVRILTVRTRFGWLPRVALAASVAMILGQTAVYAGFALTGRLKPVGFPADRAAVFDRLTHESGKHLVIVRYAPAHVRHEEWVYNAANIDAARLVWARDLGEVANRRLLEYFKDRAAWLLEPDRDPRSPRPYVGAPLESRGRVR
jgi:hypothetical protein